FGFENELASGYDSFITQTPCSYQIQSLTKTKVWRLTFSNLAEIYKTTQVGNEIGRLITETLFVKEIKRELALLNETAEKRYLNLFVERPKLIKEIPLKYIASYVGVTPQALSRIRKRIY
ncbi:MAG: Crp/Fnr family transcriptional regulator, partial [Bacteroidota bacterium]